MTVKNAYQCLLYAKSTKILFCNLKVVNNHDMKKSHDATVMISLSPRTSYPLLKQTKKNVGGGASGQVGTE